VNLNYWSTSLTFHRTSKSFVKKKAALTLLRLYRKSPEIVMLEWAERIIALMDDPDIGVTLSVTSLVIALLQENQDRYKSSYVKAAQRLKSIIVDEDCPSDYYYYKVPCPWLQVKLIKLLQYYPPSGMFGFSQYCRSLICLR
jgi:AP-2 complex subunit alpha